MSNRVYEALDIAKYIVNKCTSDNYPITNLQLQKILYFLQKKYLVEKGRRLFVDDIQAWQFGPVVPEVYYQYCGFGSGCITMEYKTDIDFEDELEIDPVVEDKRKKNPWDLVSETHAPGKAWDETYKNGLGNRNVISTERIRLRG